MSLHRGVRSMLCIAPVLFTFACGSSDEKQAEPEQGQETEWRTLLTGDWTMPPGVEDYVCVRKTLTEDVYVSAVEAVNPLGTHHTLLTIGDPDKPDGTSACHVAENHKVSIFGSGVGTNPIEFPSGVGIKLEAGKQLLLNLHLFNGADQPLSGTSGTRIVVVDQDDVEYIGANDPATFLNLNILPHQDTTTAGTYTITEDTTVFAVLPHMHQLGIHAKVTARSTIDGERVLHDAAYDFDSQLYYPVDPIRMAKGDKVEYECTWRNDTARTIHFGDSSNDEMCAVGLYRYPGK